MTMTRVTATAVALVLATAQAASGQAVVPTKPPAPPRSLTNAAVQPAPPPAPPAPPPAPPPPPPDPSFPVVVMGQTINGSLARGDTEYAGAYRDSFTFMGHQGQRIEVSMTGGFDTYLTLSGPGVSQTNDDDPAASNPLRASRVAATLPQDGAYTIIASSLGAASGRYRVNVIDPASLDEARGAIRAQAAHHMTLAAAALAQDNPRRAYQEYTAAIRLDPMNAEAFANRGVSQYRLGHFRFAAEDFERAGEINPNLPNVQANRQNALQAEDALQARRASGEGDWSAAIVGVVTAVADVYVASNGGTPTPAYSAPTYTPPTPAPASAPPPRSAPAYGEAHQVWSEAHNPANDATACVLVQQVGTGRHLVNTCGVAAEVTWCVMDTECGRPGGGNTWTIGAGRDYPIMGGNGVVHHAACRNRNSIAATFSQGGIQYRCPDSLQPH